MNLLRGAWPNPLDAVMSPGTVARALVGAVPRRLAVSSIADFAAGEGSLLEEAALTWPEANLIASDIRRAAVTHLSTRVPDAYVGRCDFLNKRSRRQCAAIRQAASGVSVILLNPPFSCRGGTSYCSAVGTVEVRTSLAMSFVVTALQYMSADGCLVAVLPAGTLWSQKDEAAWELLRAAYDVSIVAECDRNTFAQEYADTVIVRIERRRPRVLVPPDPVSVPRTSDQEAVMIFRGKLPTFKAAQSQRSSGIPFVHTSDVAMSPKAPAARVDTSHDAVLGPVVLLPRIGSPQPRHVRVYKLEQQFVISDCLFALSCRSEQELGELHRLITEDWWSSLSGQYHGSGAKFLTQRNLAQFLTDRGWPARLAARDEWHRTCTYAF